MLTFCVAVGAYGADVVTVEVQEIQYLISSIGTPQEAQFVRNGKAYDAAAAADHLWLKLKNAGPRVRTADDFIRLCASASSMSGEPYQIRFGDGRVITSASFLRGKLADYRTQHQAIAGHQR